MFTDLNGIRRYKINLHTHTTMSDGHRTPVEAMAVYAAEGYDMLAITDHWRFTPGGKYDLHMDDGSVRHMELISGCEYDAGGGDSRDGVFHVLALGCASEPRLDRSIQTDASLTTVDRARLFIDRIHEAGGLAVLAHPAWSLNTYEQLKAAAPFDATEIYNSVSEWGMSDRPYSGLAVDELAANGMYLPLLATDDTHYFDGDQCRGRIMAEADAVDSLGLIEAIRQNRFFATTGPEVLIERVDEDTVRVKCSPAVKIAFLSHLVWVSGRMVRGEGLTEAVYRFRKDERYVRAEVTVAAGRQAYSPIIVR